jgi:16S rRNA uridine-516 pseudouridylate synthase and related pseudouridylate synthases
LTEQGIKRIQEGMVLGDSTICKPASIKLVEEAADSESKLCYLTIEEGKFHQVKRMIGAAGGQVTYLKRLRIGPISLDGIEIAGSYQELTQAEIDLFKK